MNAEVCNAVILRVIRGAYPSTPNWILSQKPAEGGQAILKTLKTSKSYVDLGIPSVQYTERPPHSRETRYSNSSRALASKFSDSRKHSVKKAVKQQKSVKEHFQCSMLFACLPTECLRGLVPPVPFWRPRANEGPGDEKMKNIYELNRR